MSLIFYLLFLLCFLNHLSYVFMLLLNYHIFLFQKKSFTLKNNHFLIFFKLYP